MEHSREADSSSIRQDTCTARRMPVELQGLEQSSNFHTLLALLGPRMCCTHTVPLQIVRMAAAPWVVSLSTRQEICLARPRRSYSRSRLSVARGGDRCGSARDRSAHGCLPPRLQLQEL